MNPIHLVIHHRQNKHSVAHQRIRRLDAEVGAEEELLELVREITVELAPAHQAAETADEALARASQYGDQDSV